MIINPYTFLDPVFNGVTAAWPLSEDTANMRRESLGSGAEFFPQNVIWLAGKTKFTGAGNSYMSADGNGVELSTNTAFTITFTIKTAALSASLQDIIVKGTQPFPNFGEYRVYLSNTTLTFRLFHSSTFTQITGTITAGVDNIVSIGYDPAGLIISMKINGGTRGTVAHTGGTQNMPNSPLTLGGTPSSYGVASFNGSISNLIIWRGTYLTATQQTTLYTILNTTGFPYPVLNQIPYTYGLDANLTAGEKLARYDFGDLSTQFQDTNQLIPVVNNNDPIRRINSLWSNRYAEAPNDTVRPLSKAATLGGRATAYSNGTDTRMDLDQAIQSVEADFAIFIISKNDRNASGAGSHWLSNQSGSSSYLTHTGNDYGNYYAGHKSLSGLGGAPNSGTISYPTGFNIGEFFSVNTLFSCLANGLFPINSLLYNTVNLNPADYDTFFKDTKLNVWWALGNLAEVVAIEKTLSISDRARIRKELELKWSTSTIFYTGK